jgi:hypothetical protein
MKKRVLISILIAAMTVTAFGRKFIMSGRTFTELGGFTVELLDETTMIGGKALPTYEIIYENSPFVVTIITDETKEGTNFLVISEPLSVQYVCKNGYFGVEKLDPKYATSGYSTSFAAMNRSEYLSQRVLTRGGDCQGESAGLIGAFFPVLIKELNK